jgi:DNA-binding PadR family transcriptional regulator
VPTKRKVSNLLALAVLATVVPQPMHPYEIAALLRGRGKDHDLEIKWGSLYTVVGNLAKHGYLEVAGSERDGARPERTVYRITDAGRAELLDWTRELVSTPQPERPRFKAGLSVLSVLAPDEAAAALAERLAAIEADLAQRREAHAALRAEIPRLFLVEDEYELAMRAAEADWVRGLLAELTAGSFPGLDVWRTWHETGEIPAELRELAERDLPG